jgi:hypothetical protein
MRKPLATMRQPKKTERNLNDLNSEFAIATVELRAER